LADVKKAKIRIATNVAFLLVQTTNVALPDKDFKTHAKAKGLFKVFKVFQGLFKVFKGVFKVFKVSKGSPRIKDLKDKDAAKKMKDKGHGVSRRLSTR